MKRHILLFTTLIFSILTAFSQHTPQQIAELRKQMEERTAKYDDEVQLDSLHRECLKRIRWCDQQLKNGKPEVYAERAFWRSYLARIESTWKEIGLLWRIPTDTAETSDEDWQICDITTINRSIMRNYKLALDDAQASHQPAGPYLPLFTNDNPQSIPLEVAYPTLYDLIANNFIQTITQKISYDSSAYQALSLEDAVLADGSLLASMIPPMSSYSSHQIILSFCQQLINYHRNDKDKNAYLVWRMELLDKIGLNHPQFLKCLEQELMGFKNEKLVCVIHSMMGDYYWARATSEQAEVEDFRRAVLCYEKAMVAAYPDFEHFIEGIKENIREICEKSISVECEETMIMQDNIISVMSRNCDSIYLYIKPCNVNTETLTIKDEKEALQTGKVVWKQALHIEGSYFHRIDTTIVAIPQLPYGSYFVLATEKPLEDKDLNDQEYGWQEIHVTQLMPLYDATYSPLKLFVLDRSTGTPVSNVQVELSKKSKKKELVLSSGQTDTNGFLSLPYEFNDYNSDLTLTLRKGKDVIHFPCYGYSPYVNPNYVADNQLYIEYFTDRKIYRPGQTVQWKGIAMLEKRYHYELAPDQTLIATLMGPNRQKMGSDTLTTNEFGSVAGEFHLPEGAPLGQYYISIKNENQLYDLSLWSSLSERFQVEEYKRPTYEVTLQQPKDTYRMGDSVKVTGNAAAFAGYPLQNATVRYTISERPIVPFTGRYRERQLPVYWNNFSTITHGSCVTDEKGNFQIEFRSLTQKNPYMTWSCYKVEVTVTDGSGETHTAEQRVYVSDQALHLSANIPEWVKIGETELNFPVQAVNTNGEEQIVELHYRLASVAMPEHYMTQPRVTSSHIDTSLSRQFPEYAFFGEDNPDTWKVQDEVCSGSLFTRAEPVLTLPQLSHLPAGAYRLTLTATDDFGTPVETAYTFFLTPSNNHHFPVFEPLQVLADKSQATIGDTVTFTIGSYIHHANTLVQVFSNDLLIDERWVKLDQSFITLSYPIEPGRYGSYSCKAFLCHNGQMSKEEANTRVPFTNKIIDIEFLTFRDQLEPGEKCTVKMKLTDEHQKPLRKAELLCTLYDASLDVFGANHFNSCLKKVNYPTPYSLRTSYLRASHRGYTVEPILNNWNPLPAADHTTTMPSKGDYPILFYMDGGSSRAAGRSVSGARAVSSDNTRTAVWDADAVHKSAERKTGGVDWGEDSEDEQLPVAVPRTNFAETAFFYPFLRTNKKGEIEIEFTIPESLTRWKMLGLAHTADERTGQFEKQIVTQKPLMVTVNAPRFLYENDRLTLSATVVSQKDAPIIGEAQLLLTDAATGEELLSATQPLRVESNGNAVIDFPADIPAGTLGVTCRMTVTGKADGMTYSDGEEKTLPVLSRRQLVTETVPFFITRQGRKTFSLERLRQNSKDLTSCTMQFTPSPLWNAVVALPSLTTESYDCNDYLFNRLYANTLSLHILATHPQLEQLFTDCMNRHPETLQSKLAANEALMQILLNETPWVADAQKEEDNIRSIARLFDEQRAHQKMDILVRKLTANQNRDGGWPWFAGGSSNIYITENILIGAGRLSSRNININDHFLASSTIQKAIEYVDAEKEKRYQEWKKKWPESLQRYTLNSSDLHYLYARSLYPDSPNKNESYHFYQKKLLQQADSLPTIYQRTLAALALYRTNKPDAQKLAKDIMLKILDFSQQSEEMGMFWKKEGRGYYWDESMIDRQALIMEAVTLILGDDERVNEMAIWLLQQRRGNHWDNAKSTADACYALFCISDLAKPSEPASITLKICGETRNYADTLQIPVQEDVAGCLTHPDASDIVLTSTRDGLSYGGVFYQYYADIDSIVTTGKDIPLSVERQLYRVEKGSDLLTPITEEQPLRVGDKVQVRLVIRCDRDLEYVHLKDLRAAAFEPADGTVSGHRWHNGLSYYQSFRDASANFFFEIIRQGTYVFEYSLWVNQAGKFSSGYASIQCMYAPEFCAHSSANGTLEIQK